MYSRHMETIGLVQADGILHPATETVGQATTGLIAALVLMSTVLGGLHLLRLLVGLVAHFTAELRREIEHLSTAIHRLLEELVCLWWSIKDGARRVATVGGLVATPPLSAVSDGSTSEAAAPTDSVISRDDAAKRAVGETDGRNPHVQESRSITAKAGG